MARHVVISTTRRVSLRRGKGQDLMPENPAFVSDFPVMARHVVISTRRCHTLRHGRGSKSDASKSRLNGFIPKKPMSTRIYNFIIQSCFEHFESLHLSFWDALAWGDESK